MELRETYNKIAQDWHRDHQADTWWVEGSDRFISLLPKGGAVLDVGCAGGFKARYFVDRGLKVTGIDISENLLAIARQEVPEAQFELADMRNIGNVDGDFDGVFAQASLLHIPKAEVPAVLHGMYMYQKIKPGGLLTQQGLSLLETPGRLGELYDAYMKSGPFLNALLAMLYIGVVANVMYWGGHYAGPTEGPLAPMAVLSLFVLSAAVIGWLFLGRPAMLYLDGHKREAVVIPALK